MKQPFQTRFLVLPALGAGIAGLFLRLALYRTGFDSRHLLTPNNLPQLLCFILALGLAGYLLFLLRPGKETPAVASLPGSSLSGFAAALVLGLNAWQLSRVQGEYLDAVRMALAWLSAAGVALTALARFRGRIPALPVQTAVCLFFALDMLCRYQNWSGNPRLADYCFALPASICLCVIAYQALALPRALGSRKVRLFACLMALCLCLYSLAGSGSPMFYLGGALLAWSELNAPWETEENADVSA